MKPQDDVGTGLTGTKRTEQRGGKAYAWYVVVVLMLGSTLSFMDRQILSLLVGPIKHDLALSDTRIGLLQGLAFAMIYAFLALPLGRVADNSNRRNLIAACAFIWSAMTSWCSAAKGFWSLFFARTGVGIGEAGLSPAAVSLISDYFSVEGLGTALSVFSMGVSVGGGLALIVGGTVIDVLKRVKTLGLPMLGHVPLWRLVFLAVGIPGFVFALWVWTIREPTRKQLLKTARGEALKLSLRDVSRELGSRWRSMLGLSVCMACQAIGSYGYSGWLPAYFQRAHGWTAGQAGIDLGILALVFPCAGMFLGGKVCDIWLRRGIADAVLRLAAISALGTGTLLALATTTSSAAWSVGFISAGLLFLGLPVGTVYAAVQSIFPNQVRAQMIALFAFIVNIGGLTLGPLLPGVFDDYLFKQESMLGYSLALTIGVSSAAMFLIAVMTCRSYRHDFRLMQIGKALGPEPDGVQISSV